MPIVRGQLKDFSLQVMADKLPVFIFTPQSGGTAGTEIYASEPIEFAPAYLTGNFSVELASSEVTGVLYDVAVKWLSKPSLPGDQGYTRIDIFEGLHVPTRGGELADMLKKSPGRSLVWVGPTPPPNPQPGNLWLNSTTGDLSEWS